MRVELRLTKEDAPILKNLWPLYVHDVTEFNRCGPNRHGVLIDDEGVSTLQEQGETLNTWWKHPGVLFPYLILADGVPAGFHLIAAPPYVPRGIDVEFVVHEFFVLHPWRGRGVAERAAAAGLDRHPGEWEIATWPTHARALAFWRRVLRRYVQDRYSESEIDHPWGRRVVFRFENRDRGSR